MNRGFSLVEILIVIAIAASFVMVVGSLSGNVSGLNNLISQQLQSKSDIQQTVQVMTSEIRSAGPALTGAFTIGSVSTTSFSFYTDIRKNGTTERVRYFYASSSIWKGIIEPTGTPLSYPTSSETLLDIIDNVIPPATSTPVFRYYDSSYTGTQPSLSYPIDVSTIRLVQIMFSVDVQPREAPGAQVFNTFVDIRNLRSN